MFRAAVVLIIVGVPVTTGIGNASTSPKERRQPGGKHSSPAPSLGREQSLIAHWTFDEKGPTPEIANSSNCQGLHAQANRDIPRVVGVHGAAGALSQPCKIPVDVSSVTDQLQQITFSAWTRPSELSGYREIFRQECPERLLFSFQHDGSILSLGLNINGYVECDAQIEPAQIQDGQWHHCAATYDGQTMRVYLDGQEIGSLPRPGTIATQAEPSAYIGSSRGTGEFFRGGLDDLRIYSAALTGEEIARLYRLGLRSIVKSHRKLAKRLDRFYGEGDSFSEVLANTRRKLAEGGKQLDPGLHGILTARLKSRFPEQYTAFVAATGSTPIKYLNARDNRFQTRHAERVMELLMEYQPLTKGQRADLDPEARRRWRTAVAIEQRYERLLQRGSEIQHSPDWIKVMLDAHQHIDPRPSGREAVAPFVEPETPPTRDLTAEEAREVLRRDWLFQADGHPSPRRIRQEIQWTRELAARIRSQADGAVEFSGELEQLADLRDRAEEITASNEQLYYSVRQVKRKIAFKNPVLNFDQVLFVDMPYPQGSEWRHETRHRLGYMAVPGGRLLVLDGLSPAGHLRQLMPKPPLHGSFWRPDLSFDAHKVLFCFKPHNEKSFHLYEINIDGTGLEQLTDGIHDDLDPIYLPDGEHILFSTSRAHTYVRCMPPTNSYILARCDRDGDNIYLISRNNEPDYLPSLMPDGRVIYTRWEYTDKPLWRAQGLWTVSPDGTQVNTLWGNQSVWPDLLKDARSIPGSHRIMFTGSAHHNWFAGSVGMIDPAEGYNFPDGVTKITAEVPWPESGNGPVDPVESPHYHESGEYTAYYSPYPLSEQDFLVSANRDGKFLLYLMDVRGNRELIHEGADNIFHALPVRPRKRPPRMPDRVAWPTEANRSDPDPGILYSNNVYEGAPERLRDRARYLRILNIDPKTYTYWHKRPYISTGPVVSMVQSEGVKRVLGTVPIERDGSAAFRAPPGMALHFQLLDEDRRALQTMRSFTGVMPGEVRGCTGCHESHARSPHRQIQDTLAWSRQPRNITPLPWEDDTVSYDRYVQPVLDQYCGECHQGEGEARDTLDLTRRPGFRMFDEPYVTLTGRPSWGSPYNAPENPPPGFGIANTLMVEAYGKTDPAAYQTPSPMTNLSYNSELIDIASSGDHYDVRVDSTSLRRLILWVDCMCPYRGEQEVRSIPDPDFPGVDWLSIRPRIRGAPTIVRPGPLK